MISSDSLQTLLTQQLTSWELVRHNYLQLKSNKITELIVNNFDVKIQINTERIRSATASIDKNSIKVRKCFLCKGNRPYEQMFIDYGGYQLLVNPYPIFNQHFTIPSVSHTEQRIKERIDDMLNFTSLFENHVIFYNGPEAGASAPDHFHFQAGNRGFLPIEKNDDLSENRKIYAIFKEDVKIYTLQDYPASCVFIESIDSSLVAKYFKKIYDNLSFLQPLKDEPMINIISWKNEKTYKLVVFPRSKHRPACYFENGDKQFIISPGAVEMGGVFIIARNDDYERITPEIISEIYDQVCISNAQLQNILENL